jgi:hypothetical protein
MAEAKYVLQCQTNPDQLFDFPTREEAEEHNGQTCWEVNDGESCGGVVMALDPATDAKEGE